MEEKQLCWRNIKEELSALNMIKMTTTKFI